MLHNQVEKVIAFVIEGNYEDLRVSVNLYNFIKLKLFSSLRRPMFSVLL